jgi:hypothetical protein
MPPDTLDRSAFAGARPPTRTERVPGGDRD